MNDNNIIGRVYGGTANKMCIRDRYLVVLLDDTSVSYCHYANDKVRHNLIPIDVLRQGIK